MDKNELEKHGFSENDSDVICQNDLFLIQNYEKLFYMKSIELAQAINVMGKDELILFNNAVSGYGFNAELMREKTSEMKKYTTINPNIFGEATVRTGIFDADSFDILKEMYHKKIRPKPSIITMLFNFYPAFKEHFIKLKNAGIIVETVNGLKWNRDKIAAAEYFNHLECVEQSKRWKIIERVFGLVHLSQHLYNHRVQQNGKPSKHFEEIKMLLDLSSPEDNTIK